MKQDFIGVVFWYLERWMRILRVILMIIALAVLAALFTSCGVTKVKTVDDKSVLTTETEETIITRPPSKVVNETKYNVKYKDTTIVTTNYETKTILREVYDTQGNRKTECECEGIREENIKMKEILQSDIETSKTTDHQLAIAPLIWAIAGLFFMIVLGGILAFVMYLKMQKALPDMIANAVKGVNS